MDALVDQNLDVVHEFKATLKKYEHIGSGWAFYATAIFRSNGKTTPDKVKVSLVLNGYNPGKIYFWETGQFNDTLHRTEFYPNKDAYSMGAGGELLIKG